MSPICDSIYDTLVIKNTQSPYSRLKMILFRVLVVTLLSFSTNCSSIVPAGDTILAPTPIVVTIRQNQELSYLKSKDMKENVPVFICSSRNLSPHPDSVHPFGNQRSGEFVPYLAVADVSLGAGLSSEQILYETFNSVRRKQTRVKVEKVTMFESPKITPSSSFEQKRSEFMKSKWLGAIRSKLNKSKRKTVTVFVHGYNTHLVSNTELLAELYHYAGREGAVINYEWPSAGKLLGYFQDKGNAEFSTRLFRSFISRLAQMTGAEKIRIIAHSAGNPIVVNALKDLRLLEKDLTASELHQKYKIAQVILAAPDMDAMRFMNAVFDRFNEMSPNVSVYAYPKDRALIISSKLFGFSSLGNAIGKFSGWEKESLKRASNIQLIDVSFPQGMFGSMLGHGYFHRDPWVSSDILTSAKFPNPTQRGLMKSKNGLFWEFPQNYPQKLKEIK